MEVLDSNEVHSEGNKVSQENKQKRKLKTPAQVMALENFYNEHKYPTDEMKAKLAEQIGLTEKQISGWFCHRRLKDKRFLRDEAYACGRPDRSSGVIQDRGSGLRQDSCGSTKQVEYRNVDPREVESRRLYSHDVSAADVNYENRSLYTGNTGGMDSTSSESSSSLQDRFLSQREGSYEMEASRYLTQNGALVALNPKSTKNMGYKPSGYLKVKGKIENAAITSVKRQLGRYYREDGPPLGVEFDLLPPGSFESPSNNPLNEPICIGDSIRPHSPDASGLVKHPGLGPSFEVRKSKTSSQDPYVKGANHNIMHGSGCQDRKSHSQLKQKSPLNYSNPLHGQNSSLDMYEDSVRETSLGNSNRSRISAKHGAGGMRSDSVSFHHGPYGGNKTSKQSRPPLHDYDNTSSKLILKSEYLSKSSNVLLGCSKSLGTEESGPYTGMTKEEKPCGKRKAIMEYQDPFRVKMHPRNEFTVAKGVGVEFPHQDYVTKASYGEMSPQKNQITGSAVEMPSSFSEDETAETSSSLD